MLRWTLLVSTGVLISSVLTGLGWSAQSGPAIVAVKVTPDDRVFKDSAWNKPIVIKSADDAGKHFSKDALAALTKQVDFKNQVVLAFAWKGSGGDKLMYTVAESFPEQITFSLKRGATDDVRSHTLVFALRSNVRWSVKGAANDKKPQAKDTKPMVRPLKFAPKDPTANFMIGGMSKLTLLPDAAAVEKLVGQASAKSLCDAVDFKKETIVLVSWTTSGPPDGVLKHEIKKDGTSQKVVFFVQGPPGGGARGQRARIGADFFAIPRDMQATFEPKER
jgi:hypothetical protein